MTWSATSAFVALALAMSAATQHKWPNPKLDGLESLLYDQLGYNRNQIVSGVLRPTGCSLFTFGSTEGRSNAANWIRTAYHDMATFNINDGTGGLDGSIMFEQDRAENEGDGFQDTIIDLGIGMNRYITLSDMLAMGAAMAVEQCGGPKITYRGGRVDSSVVNNPGVPQPHEDLESHTTSFARQGFNATEMIALVACGHSIGGVQRSAFPTIVEANPAPSEEDTQATFDTTPFRFDNTVATEYIDGTTANVLVSGHNTTTNSDLRIFSSDGNVTMQSLANSPELFSATCATLLERMINTVPRGVKLTEPITPLPVKPQFVNLKYTGDGGLLLSGETRFWDMAEDSSRTITLRWANRDGTACKDCSATLGHTPDMTSEAINNGVFHSLWYSMNQGSIVPRIDEAKGISKFWYEITEGGNTRTEDQGGVGFMLQDTVVLGNGTCLDWSNFPLKVKLEVAVHVDASPSRVVLEMDTAAEEGRPIVVKVVEGVAKIGPPNATYRVWQIQSELSTSTNGLVTATAEIDGQRFEVPFDPFKQPDCPRT